MANQINTTGALSLNNPGSTSGTIGDSWPSTPYTQTNPGSIAGSAQIPVAAAAATIIGATNATPIVITTQANHGLITGQLVTIAGVQGNTYANGTYAVTVLSPTTFSIPIGGNNTYTSGGTWVLAGVPVVLGPVTLPHWSMWTNLDSTNYIQIFAAATISYSNLSFIAYTPFARLLAGENALLPLEPNSTYYVLANTAPCYLEWIILNF
jgi:hypothetical protein